MVYDERNNFQGQASSYLLLAAEATALMVLLVDPAITTVAVVTVVISHVPLQSHVTY